MSIPNAITLCASSSITAKAASDAWGQNAVAIEAMGVNNNRRRAMLIGQCAHESAKFRTRFENLNYSAISLWRVFKRHFKSEAETELFHRQPEKIANRVYAGRMGNGNTASGDGWRYRGRGFLQLTGRNNYRLYGGLIGINLEAEPDRAAEVGQCWLIAAQYVARTRRSGQTLLHWADIPNVEMVTLGINGGHNGLADRKVLTGRAFAALTGQTTTAEWQSLLLNAGFEPGPIDGLDGPKTRAAVAVAEARFGVSGDALLKKLRAIT